jgi:hypothetical protein
MADIDHQNFNPTQSSMQPSPKTIASAATIAPTTRMSFVTGTVQVATVTPPVSGYHELVLVFTNASPGAFLTSGNVQRAIAPAQNIPVVLRWDPSTAKYWGG